MSNQTLYKHYWTAKIIAWFKRKMVLELYYDNHKREGFILAENHEFSRDGLYRVAWRNKKNVKI